MYASFCFLLSVYQFLSSFSVSLLHRFSASVVGSVVMTISLVLSFIIFNYHCIHRCVNILCLGVVCSCTLPTRKAVPVNNDPALSIVFIHLLPIAYNPQSLTIDYNGVTINSHPVSRTTALLLVVTHPVVTLVIGH